MSPAKVLGSHSKIPDSSATAQRPIIVRRRLRIPDSRSRSASCQLFQNLEETMRLLIENLGLATGHLLSRLRPGLALQAKVLGDSLHYVVAGPEDSSDVPVWKVRASDDHVPNLQIELRLRCSNCFL